jgi:hypothetical protein
LSSAACWASVSPPTLIVDMPLDGLGVVNSSKGEIDDLLLLDFRENAKNGILYFVQNDKPSLKTPHLKCSGRE